MFIRNTHPDHDTSLDAVDAETLGIAAAADVERFLRRRPDYIPTPLHQLTAMASDIGVGSIFIKDEGLRLGLESFKALGGSYAVIRLVLEEASRRLGRQLDIVDLHSPQVRAITHLMTFSCATDGNHGRSVAQGAQMVGANAVIFVHAGVSYERVAAIEFYGAELVRVAGTYDDSVAEASRVCEQRNWTVVSDTSWPGYERVPSLVMQGYTAIVRESMRQMPEPPTHFFIQAGVGGVAAALGGHFSVLLGERRPKIVVVEPSRAACLFETARVGRPVRIDPGEPTVMAMLECYEPSIVAWRILSRVADAFMTIEDEEAIAVMAKLAKPAADDRPIVAGESGGAGLAGLIRAASELDLRSALGLDDASSVFVINTEGATDPSRYTALTGLLPTEVRNAA